MVVSHKKIHRQLAATLLLGLAYLLVAALSVSLARFDGGVAFIWPATALLVADLRHRPQPHPWLRVLVCAGASVLATGFFGLGFAGAVPMALVNMGEALGCLALLRLTAPLGNRLESPRELVCFILIAGLLVPALSALGGAAVAHGFGGGVPYWHNWLQWWAGHGLGLLIILPMAKLAHGGELAGWARGSSWRQKLEAATLLVLVTGTTVLVFAQSHLPLLFLPFLPMIMAIFRFGRYGAAISLLVLTLVGSAFTFSGQGPITLIDGHIGLQVQFLQFYLATAALMTLPVASELKRRQQLYTSLQESAALHQLIADRSGDVILALERDGRVRFASASVARMGRTPEDLVGCIAGELVLPEDIPAVVAAHDRAMRSPAETFTAEFRGRDASGAPAWYECHARATLDEDGNVTGTVSIAREITGRKVRELDLEKAASTDPLTGVANRRAFEDAVTRHFAAGKESAPAFIAMFDLDHFKGINDRHGHAAGDEVLKSFAAVLRSALRGSDCIARMGGEEFVVLLATEHEQARLVCERVRATFAATLVSDGKGRSLRATVSAGLAPISGADTLHEALEAADRALYRAKHLGRNQLALAA